ncbi:hypothetical protein [Nocardioides sp. TF02-7]|uniref:diacylglycerol/lipid kinase family protein n=1 Tax=Nocardioides sp. TF02-7 TaxID=2917724 RepID=UPI001F059641|nr:hypothetical protein [Nocardioides sp. TF02-7]UMG94802.1 hypothetical protein MF408_12135 [Nocardioides sp. TF02-7]
MVADVDEPVLMVALGNGASVGGGTRLTPDADPSDGLIDVLVATPAGLAARAAYAVRLPFGSHDQREDVRTYRGATVSVSGSGFWCSADGEVYGPERHRTWHLERAAYRMVLPRRDESGDDARAH